MRPTTPPQSDLPAGERERLEECSREPIRTPGSIQPHGVLLTVDPDGAEILQASSSSAEVLGVEAAALIGRPLADLLEPEAHQRFESLRDGDRAIANPLTVQMHGRPFDVIVHPVDGTVAVEFEPVLPLGADPSTAAIYGAIQRLSAADSIDRLREETARELRMLTGFDRVMVYAFHPDGHGEVVAEERAEEMEPYLGLHFPASDIPAQARQLYLGKLSRVIVSTDSGTAELVPEVNPRTGQPLDLGLAELRSVSRHHLQFMRNMGQGATFSLSLIVAGELVGMVTCAHRTPKRIGYAARQGYEILAGQVSLQLGAMAEIGRLGRRDAARSVRARLLEHAGRRDDLAQALTDGPATVLDVLPADGATVCVDGRCVSVGDVPVAVTRSNFARRLRALTAGRPIVTAQLVTDLPEVADLLPGVAGLVVTPLSSGGDFLAWYRPEVVRTVNWLGDQTPANRLTPFSPRNSFSQWTQSVTGQSLPWDGRERDAEELARDLEGSLLRRAETKLAELALRDALTGLPNRRLLMDRLDQAIKRHHRGQPLALLFIDLDGFKQVNDTLGHDAGDTLLVTTAERILGQTRAQDTVARIGGDEFVVLCENAGSAEAELIADRIAASIGTEIQLDGRTVDVGASIGIATPRAGGGAHDLLREADAAMYAAKQRARDGSGPASALLPEPRIDLEQPMRLGLERGEFVVHYQPIHRVADASLAGVEALVRWDRPGHGRIPPNRFIPAAEANGLIEPLGLRVLDDALRQAAVWIAEGRVREDFTVSVNVSPVQLQSSLLPDSVSGLLAKHRLEPRRLLLEMTESSMIAESTALAETVRLLHEIGVGICIDDFGTGYSSLSYLRYLPASQLKIVPQFVAGMLQSSRDEALVAATVNLAHRFGMTCVAEGVEEQAVLERLRILGCDFAQGFLMGRPAAGAQYTDLGTTFRPGERMP
ncbi:EAL domain-containing protein [Lysobacter korlensis]|uniref:EAL domain-containing protein n=1 Tax=Lysobacter korlensis TaxID=553636 RepID=A0ABV6RMF7_9GAMM